MQVTNGQSKLMKVESLKRTRRLERGWLRARKRMILNSSKIFDKWVNSSLQLVWLQIGLLGAILSCIPHKGNLRDHFQTIFWYWYILSMHNSLGSFRGFDHFLSSYILHSSIYEIVAFPCAYRNTLDSCDGLRGQTRYEELREWWKARLFPREMEQQFWIGNLYMVLVFYIHVVRLERYLRLQKCGVRPYQTL